MSDLTNRLRGQYRAGPRGEHTRSFKNHIPPISIEAADRIDALEAAMQEYVNDVELNGVGYGCEKFRRLLDASEGKE